MAKLTPPVIDAGIEALIRLAVSEDMGEPPSDKTVELTIPEGQMSTGKIIARKAGVMSGGFLIGAIVERYTGAGRVEILAEDGAILREGQAVAAITAPTRALLSAERVVLNFLSHLCGIATMTARYVQAIAHLAKPPVITDTRKTTPGFRVLDKYAVRCGGGMNHRMGLYDGVMLKDNHLAALREKAGGGGRGLAELVGGVRKELDRGILLWLEVDTLEQLKEALPAGDEGADIILLDNFTAEQMREAAGLRDAAGAKVLLEASGGVTLGNLAAVAATGVDRISIGALTHSAGILDLSMELD